MNIKVKFQYKIKRPKRLDNDVFVIYSPERITINPGEKKMSTCSLKYFYQKI